MCEKVFLLVKNNDDSNNYEQQWFEYVSYFYFLFVKGKGIFNSFILNHYYDTLKLKK